MDVELRLSRLGSGDSDGKLMEFEKDPPRN